MAAELSMNGRKKIETIQKEFTNKFNYLTLLFLDENRKSLDISKSLSEVRKVKGADISINAGLKVNTLEARFRDNYGLMVEVAYMKEGKVLHTKDNVDKTLNEMNRWCAENGCQKFEFKKSLRGDTVLSLQEQLFNAISEEYPDAVAKKMNKDNFMDVHLPSVNAKKGTHIFFNTAKEGIKFGFYCRDEAFVKSVLDKSLKIEDYAQGVRPVGNPLFTDVVDAAEAALAFIGELLGDDTSNNDENRIEATNDSNEFQLEDFQLIHTLVTLYSAFASQSGISDSAFDLLVDRIKLWDFNMSEDEKNTETMKALRWFTNNYDASLFSKLKIKLNELSALSENNRKSILEDLRMISNTFFEMPSAKIQLYSSIITNLGFNTDAYAIEPVTKEMIENFNNEFDVEYKSTVLENRREDGYITLFSIDVKDLNKAIAENDFSEDMLNSIGKVELGDWDVMKDLTSAEEVDAIMKDFNDVNPDYIVLLYCQGNYIHAFSSE
jgi:hypothetical protein